MTSRTLKWTTLLILLCLTFFLGSFNATMRVLVDQRKGMAKNSQKKIKQSSQTNMPEPVQTATTIKINEETSIAFSKIAQAQNQYQELKNPTLGKYKSFSRPLDGFPPSTRSQKDYQRQSFYHSYAQPRSTHKVSDAHFAKAIRMVSSSFDRLEQGGNALPHRVEGGGYRQHVRGEKFVRMNWLKKKSKRNITGSSSRRVFSALFGSSMPDWCSNAIEKIENWYEDAMGNLYDILGVEMDTEETGGEEEKRREGSSILMDRNEEDVFLWSDTRVGSQLIRIYEKIVRLWTRHPQSEYAGTGTGSSSSNDEASNTKEIMSKEDHLAIEGLYHLEQAAELGHAEAQRMVANSLASGILPLSDHSLIQRYAKWQQMNSEQPSNLTALLANSTLEVPDDFSLGGEQLSRAIVLWHLSAMDGNVESAMALGFRHLYSATGGTTLSNNLGDHISPGYDPSTGGATDVHGTTPTSHYGVLGTCPTALAYYEAAANGVMDELESGPTKGKVTPPLDEHRLAQIHMRGGASVALENHNKPDEIEEALQYYRMLASRNRSPEPDITAAFTIANFYHLGLRGVKQDLRLALKYYEICGDYNHWEGGGLAGLFHVWGIGMNPEERDLGKAYAYFTQGTPGGIEGCSDRMKQKKKGKDNDEVHNCDRHSANGMGLVTLFGIKGLVDRNVANARKWFEIAKDLGDPDAQYNYAMLRLGWMVSEVHADDLTKSAPDPIPPYFDHGNPSTSPFQLNYLTYRQYKSSPSDTAGPTASDFVVALQELSRASSKGHIQAKHKLATLYATGAEVKNKNGKVSVAVKQSCSQALQYYKLIAESGHTVSQRNRAAWKQYNSGDYESALRNYLATAEAGNIVGQMNAAFLLEQGYCLGMAADACSRASVRLWRVAARQGSLESCLRVGDFYYYGRMKKRLSLPVDTDSFDDMSSHSAKGVDGKALFFAPGPYRWARYILYPEEAIGIAFSWLTGTIKTMSSYISNGLSRLLSPDNLDVALAEGESKSDSTCKSEMDSSGSCINQETDMRIKDDEINHEHMAIAAEYYRKAAEDHKSARANFNLGFMYEWGLGLNQDFPLAKRHYDLAGEEANIAASLARFAMNTHEKVLKSWMHLSSKYMK